MTRLASLDPMDMSLGVPIDFDQVLNEIHRNGGPHLVLDHHHKAKTAIVSHLLRRGWPVMVYTEFANNVHASVFSARPQAGKPVLRMAFPGGKYVGPVPGRPVEADSMQGIRDGAKQWHAEVWSEVGRTDAKEPMVLMLESGIKRLALVTTENFVGHLGHPVKLDQRITHFIISRNADWRRWPASRSHATSIAPRTDLDTDVPGESHHVFRFPARGLRVGLNLPDEYLP